MTVTPNRLAAPPPAVRRSGGGGFASSLRVFLSFTPGFSPVIKERENHRNRFNGFSVSFARQVLCTQSPEGLETKSKPLKTVH